MTALPTHVAPRPVTAAEYAGTPETPEHRYELQEGAIVMSPRPVPGHQDALLELGIQLRGQVPPHLKVLLEVDLDLHLVPPTHPGTVRVPDLVVVTVQAFLRVLRDGGLLRADGYWMVDLLAGPSLTACHSGGLFGYVDEAAVRGTFTADAPFPVRLDLDRLV